MYKHPFDHLKPSFQATQTFLAPCVLVHTFRHTSKNLTPARRNLRHRSFFSCFLLQSMNAATNKETLRIDREAILSGITHSPSLVSSFFHPFNGLRFEKSIRRACNSSSLLTVLSSRLYRRSTHACIVTNYFPSLYTAALLGLSDDKYLTVYSFINSVIEGYSLCNQFKYEEEISAHSLYSARF